jgi:hypothetical protein
VLFSQLHEVMIKTVSSGKDLRVCISSFPAAAAAASGF